MMEMEIENMVKRFVLKMVVTFIAISLFIPVIGFTYGAVDHYGTITNKGVLSRISYYNEASFPLYLYHHDIFANILIKTNSDKTRIFVQKSHNNPKCNMTIKELVIGKITYWTILDRTIGCSK